MENLQSNINWSDELSKMQHNKHHLGYCDLKLLCSDGYIKCHKALFPTFRQNELSSSFYKTTTESELVMTTWTLKLMSKLVFVLYFGEAMISRKESTELMPIFEMLQIDSTKRQQLFTKRGKGVRVQKRKAELKLKWSELIRRKILAVRKLGIKDYEEIYMFGDGSEMAVPLVADELAETVTFYDENGSILCDNDPRLFCHPCSMIFCDSSDYISHTLRCENNHTQMTAPKRINIEPGLIKIERVDNEENTFFEDNDTHQEMSRGNLDTINVCLICVQGCNTISDLIIHSHSTHGISPDTDYDLQAWKCRSCESVRKSGYLPILLQHVVHCKKAKQKASRKRPASNNISNTGEASNPLEKRKRRKITEKVSCRLNNEIIIKEECTAGNVFLERGKPSPLASLEIINVSSLAQPSQSFLKPLLDQNGHYVKEIETPDNALDSTEENENTEPVGKLGNNEESTSLQRNVQMDNFSDAPMCAFKIPNLKRPEANNSSSHVPALKREEPAQSFERRLPCAFPSASKDEIANQLLPIKLQQRNDVNSRELLENRINIKQSPTRISSHPQREPYAIARAPESRVNNKDRSNQNQNEMCATNAKLCKTGIVMKSEQNRRSYTLNGKRCEEQRQSYGLTVDWCKKITTRRTLISKQSRWPCRRCAKVFGNQRLFMHHSC